MIHRTHPRNQDDIDVWSMTALPHFTTYFGAAHARHHPVENGEWGPIRPLKGEPGLRTVTHSLSLIAKVAHEIVNNQAEALTQLVPSVRIAEAPWYHGYHAKIGGARIRTAASRQEPHD